MAGLADECGREGSCGSREPGGQYSEADERIHVRRATAQPPRAASQDLLARNDDRGGGEERVEIMRSVQEPGAPDGGKASRGDQ